MILQETGSIRQILVAGNQCDFPLDAGALFAGPSNKQEADNLAGHGRES